MAADAHEPMTHGPGLTMTDFCQICCVRLPCDVLAYEAEIDTLRVELAALKARQWEPAPGHWYVAATEHGRTMTCVGEIADPDQARVRVALQAAHDAACRAIQQAYRTVAPNTPSPSALATAVLDAVAREMAGADEPEGSAT